MLTRTPRSLSRRPRLEAVSHLPRLDATPPVTKTCLVFTGRAACTGVAKEAPVVSADGAARRSTGSQNIRRARQRPGPTPGRAQHVAQTGRPAAIRSAVRLAVAAAGARPPDRAGPADHPGPAGGPADHPGSADHPGP